MPDLVKIGFTGADDVRQRMRSLDTTGVPVPFQLYACIEVNHAHRLEQLAHQVFAHARVRANREFFAIEPEAVVQYLTAVSLNDTDARWVATDQAMIDEDGRELPDSSVVLPRLTPFRFSAADVPIGATVAFVRDPSETATVVSDSQVEYHGERFSLSALTARLMEARGLGNSSRAYAGPGYFTFEDELLNERRRRIEAAAASEDS